MEYLHRRTEAHYQQPLENAFSITLAQLKTVVLIKEAIKLAFFRLVEYLENQHLWVRLEAQNGQKQITFF